MPQTTFTGGLDYEGKITLTLKSNGRTLKARTYKNKGRAPLFKFLGYCLMGSYEEVKQLLPTQIMLLYNTESQGVLKANPTSVEKRSSLRGLAQTPVIENDSIAERVTVTYSFEVPRASIYGGAFNQIALYGAGMTELDFKDFSAYFYLVDDFNEFESHDPDIDDWSATTVLLVDWELSLSNKDSSVNSTEGE